MSTIEGLLKSDAVTAADDAIAARLGCSIYREDLPMLAGFMTEEIGQSNLTLSQISDFVSGYPAAIAEFAQLFFGKSRPETLSAGVSVTYAIYLLYLRNRTEADLLAYIDRRRIPNGDKLTAKLTKAKAKMGNMIS